ncbi:MucR family transcriptional regulator [Croceibacterium ferulae]|uniref:MucR family transcriptional regulator n=1 Tax=Croceibacterium ferulae TaxID=1854641 RepID=UPI000EAE5869|nr:MucR family transcriptional regulator [Croceibacterium ferulae]
MNTVDNDQAETLIALTSDIVAAHVTNNRVEVADLPTLIQNVFGALQGLGASEPVEERPEPAVSVRASIKPDYLVCLEDGKKMKMLKRYLMTQYGMTPDQYRQRWNLPSDYPMVAPEYAEKRRALAKDIGLGRKPGERPGQKSAQKPGRKPKAAAAEKVAEPA